MEKIYMEEPKKKNKSMFNFSVVLSFAVAIFAVFSLVAVGFNKTSYAAPVIEDNFTFHIMKKGADNRAVNVSGRDAANTQRFLIPLYYSDANYTNPIFCIEKNASVQDGAQYNKSETINDYGLLYILNNSFVNGKSLVPDSNKYVEAWATQVAIWVYMFETQPGVPIHAITADEMEAIKNASVFTVVDSSNPGDADDLNMGKSVFDNYIRPLIDKAKSATSLKQITVTKADGDIDKTSDGKFYQTTKITVMGNPSSDLVNYNIELSGIDGAFAVDVDGNTLKNENISAGQEFYVRIPVDKVGEAVQTLNINVTGHFNTLTGNVYTSGNYQKVVSVYGGIEDVSNGISIEIVGAPDTGMNSAQTIYFIGLIVLLCGVGIIYANAKPVEVKQ